MGNLEESAARRQWALHAAIAGGAVVAVMVFAGLATAPNIPTWYAGLKKPWFNPPNWVFGPAWSVLYPIIAYALFRILQLPASTPGRGAAIAAWFVQLALNCGWSLAFFAARSTSLGLVVVAAMWLAIAATARMFWPLDRVAAWVLAPYLAWVSFAAALNFAVWRLNP